MYKKKASVIDFFITNWISKISLLPAEEIKKFIDALIKYKILKLHPENISSEIVLSMFDEVVQIINKEEIQQQKKSEAMKKNVNKRWLCNAKNTNEHTKGHTVVFPKITNWSKWIKLMKWKKEEGKNVGLFDFFQKNKRIEFDNFAFHNMTIDKDDKSIPEMTKLVESYIKKFEYYKNSNLGIVFLGNIGVGKTFYASCIINGLIEKGYSVIINNLNKMVHELELNLNQYLKNIRNVDLLVIDDFLIENENPHIIESIYLIVNERYLVQKPIIITTNLFKEEFDNKNFRYARIYDRIKSMCGHFTIKGETKRTSESIKKIDALKILMTEIKNEI